MDEVIFASAAALARAIRQRDVSSREVVEAYLRRIEEVNPTLHAVVQFVGDRALAEAEKADEGVARGEALGPLHGVPMTIKDSLDTEGVVSTGGTRGRASYVPQRDATAVARLRTAGAILLGKTNTSELTLAGETNNLIYPLTNNPYDLTRTPGGSSGGAAAIVAAGGSAFDLGSDTGGSIRWPAHCCGLASIKPTSGRVPRTGHVIPHGMGALDSLTQIGPMTRYVADAALVLSLISGPDGQDPGIVPMPLGDFKSVGLRGLRVAFHTDNGVARATPETARVVRAATDVLAEAGVGVEEDVPTALAGSFELDPLGADGMAWVRRLLHRYGTTEVHPALMRWMERARPMGAAEYTALLERVDDFRSAMLSFMQGYDAILCPVFPSPAFPHGATFEGENPRGFTYTSAYNRTGWPAATVRAGMSAEGLPLCVQVVARPWREDVALALAERIEVALGGWQRPPL